MASGKIDTDRERLNRDTFLMFWVCIGVFEQNEIVPNSLNYSQENLHCMYFGRTFGQGDNGDRSNVSRTLKIKATIVIPNSVFHPEFKYKILNGNVYMYWWSYRKLSMHSPLPLAASGSPLYAPPFTSTFQSPHPTFYFHFSPFQPASQCVCHLPCTKRRRSGREGVSEIFL